MSKSYVHRGWLQPGSREFFAPRRKNAPAQRKGTDLPNFLKRAVVLVVEDEPFLRMIAVDLVEEAGFEPVQAAVVPTPI